MKIRNHIWVANRCIACGAWFCTSGFTDQRSCVEREDYQTKLAPEPARRQYAYEDAATISARIAELDRERIDAMNAAPKE